MTKQQIKDLADLFTARLTPFEKRVYIEHLVENAEQIDVSQHAVESITQLPGEEQYQAVTEILKETEIDTRHEICMYIVDTCGCEVERYDMLKVLSEKSTALERILYAADIINDLAGLKTTQDLLQELSEEDPKLHSVAVKLFKSLQ